jgi:hypothetical protein
MIYSPLSSFTRSTDMPQAAGAILSENGQALVHVIVDGKSGVTPSTGAAAEKFAGFANMQTSAAPVMPTSLVRVEDLIVPVSGKFLVAKAPMAGTTSVFLVEDNTVIAVVAVVANEVDVGVANAGKFVRCVYRSPATVAEARARVGDIQPGGYVGNIVGQVGVAQQGVIYTSVFDTEADWASATAITLGAGGVLEADGAGEPIQATLVALPSPDYPFLGIRFDSIV